MRLYQRINGFGQHVGGCLEPDALEGKIRGTPAASRIATATAGNGIGGGGDPEGDGPPESE